MLDGRRATIERIFTDYDGKTHLGVTIDDDPGQELMRETGPLPVFLCPRGGGDRHMSRGAAAQHPGRRRRQRLAARRRVRRRGGPAPRRARAARRASSVMDAGTGGLDLAYEVMRGYDALVILDVSKQGGEPGTLYVMEPDEESVPGAIEDGDVINPHGDGSADGAAVRQVGRSVAGAGGRDRVRTG